MIVDREGGSTSRTSASPAPGRARSPRPARSSAPRSTSLRAGSGRARRRELRPVLDRDRALRAAHRPRAVHGREPGRDRDEAPLGAARAAVDAAARDPARPRPRRPPRAAKEPADRYRTAGEMDRDLELVARGEPVGQETESAATVVLAGGGALEPTAATRVVRRTVQYGGDERYRAYDAAVRRDRAWWPWLLAIGAILALAAAGLLPLRQHPGPARSVEPVSVGDYEGPAGGERRQPDHPGRLRAEGEPAPERRRRGRHRL